MDYSGIKDTLSTIGSNFQGAVERFQKTEGGRRLAATPNEVWWPMVGLSMSSRYVGDTMSRQGAFEYNVLGLLGKRWVDGKFEDWYKATEKQPVGMHFRMEPTAFFNVGLIVKENTYKFG